MSACLLLLIIHIAINLLMGFMLYMAYYGGINQGIIPTLFNISSFYSAIVFYFIFKEKSSLP